MKRTIPDYLTQADNLILTVVMASVFSILFLTAYTPFSDTSWFNLRDSERFVLTTGLISTGILIVATSRLLMYYRGRKKKRMMLWQYVLWNLAEAVLTAATYTVVTITLIDGTKTFGQIFPKGFILTALMLAVPYAGAAFIAGRRDRNRMLRIISNKEAVSDTAPKNGSGLIHISDNNGNLKLSLRRDNLLYIESQDNYVKVYYTSLGKLQSYLVRCKLKTIEDNFAGEGLLMRCHRSYIVNISKVKILRRDHNSYVVDLDHSGTTPIPVSKKYFESFAASLKK